VRFVISEQMSDGVPLADQRAQWECNRRAGRSQQFNVVCDSWRDSSGKLWDLNHKAPISAAVLKLIDDGTWTIGSVAFVRDENGQHASLSLMPAKAFAPEPWPLNPLPPFVRDVENNNPTRPQGSDLQLPSGTSNDINLRSSDIGSAIA
jgi:prophage tail gpP-like protein